MIRAMSDRPTPSSEAALRELQRITDAALASLSMDELLRELLERIAAILDTDTAAFLLVDEVAGDLVAQAAKGIEEEVEQGVRIPMGRGFAGRIAAQRRPVLIEDVDHADILNPILREKGIRSLLGVPLLVEGRVIGVLHVGSLTRRVFDEREADLLQLAADRAAIAIEHARLHAQRHVVEAMQRAMLPTALPVIPGIQFTATYRPAAVDARVGGDWYDVFELGRGRLALVIGDVVGRGVEAGALMAQVRTALRAYALEGHEPAELVELLNRLFAAVRPTKLTTLIYMVLDPERAEARLVSAGHLPPIIVGPDGVARLLDVEGDPPVGAFRAAIYHERTLRLEPGSRVVLVTDGAAEVRGEPLDVGLERLRLLSEQEPDPRELCGAIAGGAASNGPSNDDVAVLVADVQPLPERLVTRWPADADALGGLRHLLRRWLVGHGATENEIYDITVAVQEAAANAVEHAYAPGTAAFSVDAHDEQGQIVVTVTDRGSWREARGENRGRGFPLMRGLMESVEVEPADHGTSVVLKRTLQQAPKPELEAAP
jgi:serine phosphatase RsbU (regulator of sigma subunit)/anti-sigma regulatory factor (Ser/Thr protein kinase)